MGVTKSWTQFGSWTTKGETKQDLDPNTVKVLNFVAERRNNVSPTMAQISQSWGSVFRVCFDPRGRSPHCWSKTKQQLVYYLLWPQVGSSKAFPGWLGSILFGFQIMAFQQNPNNEALKRQKRAPSMNRDHLWAFAALRQLSRAPAPGFRIWTSPQYVHERWGVELGVLTQKLGLDQTPGTYFSTQLDSVALGWPGCLWAGVASVLLVMTLPISPCDNAEMC